METGYARAGSLVAGERNQRHLQPFWSKIPVIGRPLAAATPFQIQQGIT
jgi:hypothetical protein